MRTSTCLLVTFLLGLCSAQLAFPGQSSRPRQNFRIPTPGGYLPPVPQNPMCVPQEVPFYVTSTRREVATSYVDGPGGGVSTSIIRSTQVVPTTIIRTDAQTSVSTYRELVTSSQIREVTSTYVTTIGGIPVITTVTRTSTIPQRIVSTIFATDEQIRYVTSTQIERDVATEVRPVTVTRTQDNVITQTSSVRGQDNTRTSVATSKVVSTVQTQPAPVNIVQTQTIPSVIVTTTRVQPDPTTVTQVRTSTQVDQVTITTTLRDVVTSTQRVVSTQASVVTVRDTKIQTVLSTNVIKQSSQVVVTSTRLTTLVQATTVYGTDVITRTDSQPPVYRTSTVERVVTETRPGGVNVVTNTRYSTAVVKDTSYVGGGIRETVTVTRTTKVEPCDKSGYNYDAPASPFSF